MDNLALLLQRERLLLELLVFKIIVLRHLLADGDVRFLGWAAEEVERAVEAVRLAELERAIVLEESARGVVPAQQRGADVETDLLERLIAAAPEPWQSILGQHRDALDSLSHEVADGLVVVRRLSEAGSDAIAALFSQLGEDTTTPADSLLTYGPGTTTTWSAPAPRVRTTL